MRVVRPKGNMDKQAQLYLTLDMLKEVVERDIEIPLKTTGLSMRPSIHSGEWIVVRRAGPPEIGVGDVVVYQAGNAFIAHRVIRRRQQADCVYLAVKGDAQLVAEEIAADRVVARVVALRKGDRRIDWDRPRWRLVGWLMACYSSWVDALYRAVPCLPGRLVGSLNYLAARLLAGSWEAAESDSNHKPGKKKH